MEWNCQHTFSDGTPGFSGFLDAIAADLEQAKVPAEVASRAMVAFDEIVSNILLHGAPGSRPTVTVLLRRGPHALVAEVLDDGAPFDPLTQDAPDVSLSVEERPIGGLGIHLVRKLMDSVEYTHDGTRNRLRFSKTYAI
jgi:serine/threonine-protein kinase RsbW